MPNPCVKHTILNVTPPHYKKYTLAQKILPPAVLLFAPAQSFIAPARKSLIKLETWVQKKVLQK